jgi:Xaa-Pro aminopeptidase
MTTPIKQTLYCYVDETGQDTKGGLFVVSVVISDSAREQLIAALETIETRSGKGRVKWMKVRHRQRLAYITDVLSAPQFAGTLFFSMYTGTRAYMATTVLTTAKAILRAERSQTPAVVYVDGLPKSRLRWFGVELRRMSIRTDKIVGVRKEESDALIRLADACCGFVRAALSGERPEMTALFEKAKTSGHLVEV